MTHLSKYFFTFNIWICLKRVLTWSKIRLFNIVAILDVQGINICLVRIWKLNEIRTKRGKILKFELDLVKNTIYWKQNWQKPKIREMKSNERKIIVFTFFKNEKRFTSFSSFFLNYMNTRLMMRERWVGKFYGSCDTMKGKVETFQLKMLII